MLMYGFTFKPTLTGSLLAPANLKARLMIASADSLAGEDQDLFREIDDVDIPLIDDETPANSGKHVILQLLEHLVEEMQLECHLAALAIRQYKVRIVAVGTDIDNLVRGDSNQFGTGRYSEPFHTIYVTQESLFLLY